MSPYEQSRFNTYKTLVHVALVLSFVAGVCVGAGSLFFLDKWITAGELRALDERVTATKLMCLESWSEAADLLKRSGVKVMPRAHD